jgi:uncharacterized membrane protein (DUF485 family)
MGYRSDTTSRFRTTPEMTHFRSSFETVRTTPDDYVDFVAIQRSDDFVRLRKRILNFVAPVTVLFLAWYLCYVLLAAFAHSFMSHRLVGEINVGLVLGLLQFVSTVLITIRYARFADRKVDPEAARIRAAAEGTPDDH